MKKLFRFLTQDGPLNRGHDPRRVRFPSELLEGADPVNPDNVRLEVIQLRVILEAFPVGEGPFPVGCGEVVEGFPVAELEGEGVRLEGGGLLEGLGHLGIDLCAGVDPVTDIVVAESHEELPEPEMIGGGVRLDIDRVEGVGKGPGVVAFLRIVGAELLVDDGNVGINPGCEEKLLAGAFPVTVPGKEFPVKEEGLEVVRVAGNDPLVFPRELLEATLDFALIGIGEGGGLVEALLIRDDLEEFLLEKGQGCGRFRGRPGIRAAATGSGKEESEEDE